MAELDWRVSYKLGKVALEMDGELWIISPTDANIFWETLREAASEAHAMNPDFEELGSGTFELVAE